MHKQDIKNLKRRYLVWFYKTTKEALDKIERKFTQVEVDKFILKELKKQNKAKGTEKLLAGFEAYMLEKEMDGFVLKYDGKQIRPEYTFLVMKLQAVEKAIQKELGNKALDKIKVLYEREMTERILKSTEH
ncbi:MAG: hypothetical protein NT060_02890 [Candidatus Omnitrophica bacterium]|nr:hypothetical protein [Candidatus Omnitrophota bacterium]